MKQNPKLSAVVLALALGSAATYSWAQGYSNDTYGDPPGAAIGTESQERQMEPVPSDSTMGDTGLQDQSSMAGPQGPIRSEEDMSGNTLPGLTQGMNSDPFRNPTSARDAPRFDRSAASADRGFEGFLQFQERGTNSP